MSDNSYDEQYFNPFDEGAGYSPPRYVNGWENRNNVYIMPHTKTVDYYYNRFSMDRYFDQKYKNTLNAGLACCCPYLLKVNKTN